MKHLFLLLFAGVLMTLAACGDEHSEPVGSSYQYGAQLYFCSADGMNLVDSLQYDSTFGSILGVEYTYKIGEKISRDGLTIQSNESGQRYIVTEQHIIYSSFYDSSSLTITSPKIFGDSKQHNLTFHWSEKALSHSHGTTMECIGATFDGQECAVTHPDNTNRIEIVVR